MLQYKKGVLMNNFFPIKIQNKTITKEMYLEALNYIICFIENHFNCNLENYRNALSVFKSLLKTVNGVNDHKPGKEYCKQAFDVLEEILNYDADEETKRKNREACSWCKFMIEKCY